MKFRINAECTRAYGKGHPPLTFEVVRKLGYMPNGRDAIYEVRMPGGQTWTVSDRRGKLIKD